MKHKFALVIDGFDNCTGVKTFYEDFILYCENNKIPLLLISDSTKNNTSFYYVDHKCCKRKESNLKYNQLDSVRPRPFIAFSNSELSFDDKIGLEKTVSDLAIKYKITKTDLIKLDALQDISYFARISNKIKSWIDKFGINKIYIATQSFLGFSAIRLKNNSNMRFIIHFHTDYPEFYFQRIIKRLGWKPPAYYDVFKKSMYLRLASYFMNAESSLIFPTKYFLNKMMPYIRKTNCTTYILNSGVSAVKADISKAVFIKSRRRGEIILLYVGRVEHDKNIKLLVNIDTSSILRGLKIVWWIVGEGSLLGFLKGKLHNAKFWGNVKREELYKIYNCADYLIFPSIYDTCGKTVLEAMTCNLPVVSTNKGGPASYLINGKHALLCKPDHNEFINAILFYELNPQKKKIITDNAYLAVKKYYSDKMNAKLLDIIERS